MTNSVPGEYSVTLLSGHFSARQSDCLISVSHGNSVRVYNTVAALAVILLNFNIQREKTTISELLVNRHTID